MAQALPMIALSLAGGLAGKAIGKLIGGSKKEEAAPAAAPAAPAVMPTPDDSAVQLARKRSIIQQLGRRGRQSTILTQPSDTLGG